MELQNITLIALIGSIAGLLGGVLGLGGAIIIIPALVMLLGYSQQMAQGTALMMMVLPVGGLAAFQYYQKGFVDVKAALIMAVFFFGKTDILKKTFAIMLVGIAIKMWFQK